MFALKYFSASSTAISRRLAAGGDRCHRHDELRPIRRQRAA
jgi:hypothetical protein